MKRRFIPTIPMAPATRGAYASVWEDFNKAFVREHSFGYPLKEWKPKEIVEDDSRIWGIKDIPDVCGTYVFLSDRAYVLYVGKSKHLNREIRLKFRSFKKFKREFIVKVAAHQARGDKLAEKMESDLLWYYTPPWNTRFGH
jgi:hypothetical protein